MRQIPIIVFNCFLNNVEVCLGTAEHVKRYGNPKLSIANPIVKAYYQIVNSYVYNRDKTINIIVEEERGMNSIISKLKQILLAPICKI